MQKSLYFGIDGRARMSGLDLGVRENAYET